MKPGQAFVVSLLASVAVIVTLEAAAQNGLNWRSWLAFRQEP